MARSLRHRNFRLFFTGQSISLVGTWLTRVATSWLVYRLSHSALVLGLVSFASLAPTFFLTPIAGVFVDRWNKHRVLTLMQILAMVQSAILAALTIAGTITITQLYVLSVAQGLINAFEFPTRQSLLVQMIDDRADLPNAVALNSTMVNLARMLGPAMAGVLIAAVGEGGCFAIDAISYLAVIATLLMMRLRPSQTAAVHQPFVRGLRDGLAYARRTPVIFSVLVLIALVSLAGLPFMTLLPIIVTDRLGGDATTLSALTAASGLGALSGALYLTSRTQVKGLGTVTWRAAFTCGVALIGFGAYFRMWYSLPMMYFAGLGAIVQAASSNTILQSVVEESKRARIMALFAMAYAGMMPIGSLLAGLAAEYIGAARTLQIGGVICCVGALVFRRALPAIRRRTHQPQPHVEDLAADISLR
jgi:MFS family permease